MDEEEAAGFLDDEDPVLFETFKLNKKIQTEEEKNKREQQHDKLNERPQDPEVAKTFLFKKHGFYKTIHSEEAEADGITDPITLSFSAEIDDSRRHTLKSVATNLLSHWSATGKTMLGRTTNKPSGKYEDTEYNEPEDSREEIGNVEDKKNDISGSAIGTESKSFSRKQYSQRPHFSRAVLWKYVSGMCHVNSWEQYHQNRRYGRLFRRNKSARLRESCWKKAIGNELHITPKLYETLEERVHIIRRYLLQVSQRYRTRLEHTLGVDSLENVEYTGETTCTTCLELWHTNTVSAFETISADLHRTLPRLGILINNSASCLEQLDKIIEKNSKIFNADKQSQPVDCGESMPQDNNNTINESINVVVKDNNDNNNNNFYPTDVGGSYLLRNYEDQKSEQQDVYFSSQQSKESTLSKQASNMFKDKKDSGIIATSSQPVNNNFSAFDGMERGNSFSSNTSQTDNEGVKSSASTPPTAVEACEFNKSSAKVILSHQDDEEMDILKMYSRLRLILEMFVLFRPDIGYVQGMAYLAAMFLLIIRNPYDAFVCFTNLLFRESLNAFYTFDVRKLKAYFYVFDNLLKEKLPEISQFLSNEQIPSSQFLTDWMYTIFTRCLPLDILIKVWDLFLHKGDAILFQISLALLNHSFKQLNFPNEHLSTLTSTTSMIRKLDSFKKDVFFQECNTFQISSDKFRHLLQEAYDQAENSDNILNVPLNNTMDLMEEESNVKKDSEGSNEKLQRRNSGISINGISETLDEKQTADVQCYDDLPPQLSVEQGGDVSSSKKKKILPSIIFRLQHQAIKPFFQDTDKKQA